ncbi:MAG: tetratricopeptide repeat protein [Gammaproteobacteria bacterium]|nr:tetratricopeptide repeat protein [Gammaproteobacteria bacterium]
MKQAIRTSLILSATTVALGVSHVALAQEDAEAAPAPEAVTLEQTDGLEELEADGIKMHGDPVYDDDLNDLWEHEPSEREREIVELRDAFENYKSAIENGEFQEADTLAKRIVELSIKLNGLDSHESAKALTNLALVQNKNQEYESAQLNFVAAIDIIERIEDRLHKDLVNPLKGLGASQLQSGRPDLALQTFSRAKHVSHVNDGPHNKEQVDVLNSVAETYIALGEVDEALDVQQSIYNVESRGVDTSSLEIVPALERQATWLHRLRLYHKERNNWRKILRIIEVNLGDDDLSLIPPLTSLGKSYLFIGSYGLDHDPDSPIVSGEIYLKRAMRIAERNPDSNWQLAESTKLALADYYTLSSRPNRAKRYYTETWELLSEDPSRYNNRREHLQSLVTLQNIYPPKYYNSDRVDDGSRAPESFERGRVAVEYSITARGETSNVKIVESEPPIESMENALKREMRYLMRRPRMEEGEMVQTHNLVYTHEFFYRPSDLISIEGTEVAAENSDN